MVSGGAWFCSNATQAGDHFTPRDVIALMVDILFHTEDDTRSQTRHRPHIGHCRHPAGRHLVRTFRPANTENNRSTTYGYDSRRDVAQVRKRTVLAQLDTEPGY